MVKINRQDACHQYDEEGRAITTWDEKKCSWIVEPEFEDEEIDWYGKDSDFPAGCTLKEYISIHPNWDKTPDIKVEWTWNTKETCINALGSYHEFKKWYDNNVYPFTHSKCWGYINEPKETATERFGKYCDYHKHADNIRVLYNEEEIFNGKII